MPLSEEQRRTGKQRHRLFMVLNGVPVAFLMDNVLVLYGLRNGMSDSAAAVLASFVHLSMPFMVLGRKLVARFGLTKAWALSWALRYVSVLLLVAAPFAASLGQWAATGTVMMGAFGFALFRSLGAINGRPVVGEITTPDERGRYVYGNFARFSVVNLASMSLAVLVMQNFDAVWVYQVIIGVGAAVGFAGAYVISTIPETGTSSEIAKVPIKRAASELFSDTKLRRTVWAFGAGISAIVLVIPFATITTKGGYGVPDHEALLFTLLVATGGVLSSLFNREISDHVGPRPLLIIYACGFAAVAAYWALAPETYNPVLTGATFVVSGFCRIGIFVGLGHYLLSVSNSKNRLSTTLFSEIVGGATAGIAGSVVGASLLGALQTTVDGMEGYRWYFRIILAVIVGCIVVIARLRRVKDWRVPEVLGLFLTPRDLWALYTLNRLDGRRTAQADLDDVARLRRTKSHLSQARIRRYLDSPRLEVRMAALRALRRIRMDAESRRVVAEQLDKGPFTTAALAADILGEHGIRAAVPRLRSCLDSPDPLLVGRAMVNLVRLRDKTSYNAARDLLREATEPALILHGSKAIALIGDVGDVRDVRDVPLLLDAAHVENLPAAVVDEVLISCARLCGIEDEFYEELYANGHPTYIRGEAGETVVAATGNRTSAVQEWLAARGDAHIDPGALLLFFILDKANTVDSNEPRDKKPPGAGPATPDA